MLTTDKRRELLNEAIVEFCNDYKKVYHTITATEFDMLGKFADKVYKKLETELPIHICHKHEWRSNVTSCYECKENK